MNLTNWETKKFIALDLNSREQIPYTTYTPLPLGKGDLLFKGSIFNWKLYNILGSQLNQHAN